MVSIATWGLYCPANVILAATGGALGGVPGAPLVDSLDLRPLAMELRPGAPSAGAFSGPAAVASGLTPGAPAVGYAPGAPIVGGEDEDGDC